LSSLRCLLSSSIHWILIKGASTTSRLPQSGAALFERAFTGILMRGMEMAWRGELQRLMKTATNNHNRDKDAMWIRRAS
jgi:hypothetical protein